MNLKKIGKVFTSKFVGTGPASYKKRIYRAAVSQRLRNTVIECTYTNLDSLLHTYAIWYSILLLGYKPVQHVTVLNTVDNCNKVVKVKVKLIL